MTPDYLRLKSEVVRLGSPDRVWVDVKAYGAAAAAAPRARSVRAYHAALPLYAGDLLPDDLYDDWVIPKREELAQSRLGLLFDLTRAQEETSDFRSACATLERLLETDPAHEEAHAGLMRLHAMILHAH